MLSTGRVRWLRSADLPGRLSPNWARTKRASKLRCHGVGWIIFGQSALPHQLPIVHGDKVKIQMKLVGEIERNEVRALMFHDYFVLIEDHVVKL